MARRTYESKPLSKSRVDRANVQARRRRYSYRLSRQIRNELDVDYQGRPLERRRNEDRRRKLKERRPSDMRNRLRDSTLVIAGLVVAAAVLGAQEPPTAKTQASPPDLSGVWNKKNIPGTRYGGYTFSAEEPSMTPWALERFKSNKPSFGPRMVEDSNDPVNPTTVSATGCFPPGVPRVYLHPFPLEIIQSPTRVLMIFEFDHYIRQIWTDGRPHDTALGPTWFGDSTGRWEGDTLVVDTVGFNDK